MSNMEIAQHLKAGGMKISRPSGPEQHDRIGHHDYLGRPVDVAQLADGSLLVSDVLVGALYRITL